MKSGHENLVYSFEPTMELQSIVDTLREHPEIQFVSLVGIDYRGHATDEKIPIREFLDRPLEFLAEGIQTDGSSVVLHEIATLDDARVQIIPDREVKWFVDYNEQNIDPITERPVGTLKIPSFLVHNGQKICARSILKQAVDAFKKEILSLLAKANVREELGIPKEAEIENLVITIGTELEFWIKTPEEKADREHLHTSQVLKEQYWKKTRGKIRTTLEKTLMLLERVGLQPEMGHKEVGGVKARISQNGEYQHIMEQLEIDWRFSHALQACDNDVFVRDMVIDQFQNNGMEVTLKAKPIEDVAGSGKHTHIGVLLLLKDGSKINLFSPKDMTKDYLTSLGFGALMGILKHYEVINPFISNTTDALNRLKPGFEAPIAIVTSLGGTTKTDPSRNRTVLIGLIKEVTSPLATRFELRSPNPLSNSYLYVAACIQAMLDGIRYVVEHDLSAEACEKAISKAKGETVPYLEAGRMYRSESNVFETFTAEEREALFGKSPRTVWENIRQLDEQKEKRLVLLKNGVFTEHMLASYKEGVIEHWLEDLLHRLIEHHRKTLKNYRLLHENERVNELDVATWNEIECLKEELMKDNIDRKSLFTQIELAAADKDYDRVSDLQLIVSEKMERIHRMYQTYKRNLMN